MKLAGIELAELQKQERRARAELNGEIRERADRDKRIINRVKRLLPYETVLGMGTLASDGCPRCGELKMKEEAWGWFSVFEYYHCNHCGWEFGRKYPRPSAYGG